MDDFSMVIPAEAWQAKIYWSEDGFVCWKCDEVIKAAFAGCTVYHLCSVILDHIRTHQES